MILKAEKLCKERNVRLLIVDSLMALLRAEYVGIGMLAKRQGVLNNMIYALSRTAKAYNAAIVDAADLPPAEPKSEEVIPINGKEPTW